MAAPKRDISVDEVLPPASHVNPIAARLARSKDPTEQATARILAKYLDELIPIPGTKFRIGLDPILALIPGVGDTVASGAGVIIMLDALRSGVPLSVLMRMGANMGINFLIGLVPGLGAAGSAFFKSNSRNLRLLTHWQSGQRDKVKRSTFRFFAGIMILITMAVLLVIAAGMFYVWLFYKVYEHMSLGRSPHDSVS